jgi:NifU-like protein involved in Fe-S cluster formation
MAEIKKSTIFLGVAVLAGLVAAVKFLMPSKTSAPSAPMTVTNSPTDSPSQEMSAEAAESSEKPTAGMPVEAAEVMGKPVDTTTSTRTAPKMKEVSVKKSYENPAGGDDVMFTLVVDATGIITDAKTGILAIHDISKKRQLAFAEGLPAAVKGKKLSELTTIDRVGGSSLTTKAFNDALTELKAAL